MQKATPPFRVSPGERSPTTSQTFGLSSPQIGIVPYYFGQKHCFATQFLIIVKMFLPLTGLSLLWGMGGDPPPAKNLLIHPPGKTPPVDSTIVCTPFLLGGWTSYQIFKKGGLKGSQFLKGVAGKEGVTFFRGLQFLCKKYSKIWNI